ncbi:MAG: FkbM family methyltransferase [Desulfobacterales bacterium]|nr:FkbM family methyltransferase [Desulfobacterales bacterium]
MQMSIYPADFERAYDDMPITLVDVGASGGMMPMWQPHSQHIKLIGFEPDTRAFEALKQKQNALTVYFNTALHRQSGQIPFYLTRKQQNSSSFVPNHELLSRFPNPARFDVVDQIRIDCHGLDEFLRAEKITDVDFIKLDTQGAELPILEGASDILQDSLFGMEIEVQFAPLYKDCPLFPQIDQFVGKLGYDLIDMRLVSWKRNVGAEFGNSKGQIVFADTLYFRKIENFKAMIGKCDHEMARSKLLRAISVCLIYGFADYALELLDLTAGAFFTRSEIESLQVHIKQQTSLASRLPQFPGRKFLHNMFHKLSIMLAQRKHKAVISELGNHS